MNVEDDFRALKAGFETIIDPEEWNALPNVGKHSTHPENHMKYLDVEKYLRIAVAQYRTYVRPSDQRVLDIGSGAGWFAWVCEQNGHDVLCIDRRHPFYDAMTDMFGLRKKHRIVAQDGTFAFPQAQGVHCICALTAVFTQDWTPDDWRRLLADAKALLAPGGRVSVTSAFDATPETVALFESIGQWNPKARELVVEKERIP